MRGRLRAYAALAAVLAAVLVPPLVPPAADSFPLSTYPMFSHDRGPRSAIATLVGLDADGGPHRLSPPLIGGTDEPMLAVATAGRAARGSAAEQARLCAQVAERVAGADRAELVEVALQVEEHDSVPFLTGQRTEAAAVRVLARCEVRR
ncbi:MAG: hypothetical protein ACLGI8_12545 [Acidimicrobiia bacterium]